MAYGCCLLGNAEIWIDDEVMLSPYSMLASGDHLRAGMSFRFGPVSAAPIRIGRGSWIGGHATVTAGVVVVAPAAVDELVAEPCVVVVADPFLALLEHAAVTVDNAIAAAAHRLMIDLVIDVPLVSRCGLHSATSVGDGEVATVVTEW